jgi:hypothetical protein
MATAETQLTPSLKWWLERRKKTMLFNLAKSGKIGITEVSEKYKGMRRTFYLARHRYYARKEVHRQVSSYQAAAEWYNKMESALIPAEYQVFNRVQP